jgi:hypothetical protein
VSSLSISSPCVVLQWGWSILGAEGKTGREELVDGLSPCFLFCGIFLSVIFSDKKCSALSKCSEDLLQGLAQLQQEVQMLGSYGLSR